MLYFFMGSIVFGGLFYLYATHPRRMGKHAERKVAKILKRFDGFAVNINDVLIDDAGKAVQIDHIFISQYGIFVFETKQYAGKILGAEQDETWQQVLCAGRTKYKIINPITQNKQHIALLKKAVAQLNNVAIHGGVIFSHRAELAVSHKYPVMHIDELKPYLDRFKDKIFSEVDIALFKQAVETVCEDASVGTNNNHLQHDFCPECGAEISVRETLFLKETYVVCENDRCFYKENLLIN